MGSKIICNVQQFQAGLIIRADIPNMVFHANTFSATQNGELTPIDSDLKKQLKEILCNMVDELVIEHE